MKPSDIKYLIIHCSDSPWGDAAEIRRWHTDPKPKGNGWNDIGYHYVICNQFPTYNSKSQNKPVEKSDGAVQKGRDETTAGSHCLGYNAKSLGICLVGKGKETFTERQMQAVVKLVKDLMAKYKIPAENVLGHYETPESHGKTCPNMSMPEFRKRLA